MPDRSLEPLCVKKEAGGRYKYGSLTFWAEGGGVYMLDDSPKPGTERQKSITLTGWRERMDDRRRAVKLLELQSHHGNEFQKASAAQTYQVQKDLLTAMQAVEADVVRQGDIMNPKVQEYYKKHVAPVKRTFQVLTNILPH